MGKITKKAGKILVSISAFDVFCFVKGFLLFFFLGYKISDGNEMRDGITDYRFLAETGNQKGNHQRKLPYKNNLAVMGSKDQILHHEKKVRGRERTNSGFASLHSR